MAKISTRKLAEAIHEATLGLSAVDSASMIKNIVVMLKNRKMLGKSEEILKHLQDIIDQKSGIVRAKISSAKAMSDTDKKEVEKELKEKYKAREIISEYFEKRELLGGMKVEVGNEVWDNTYRNKLNQLSKLLIKN